MSAWRTRSSCLLCALLYQSNVQELCAYIRTGSQLVSVITPSYQRFADLLACVQSVRASVQVDEGIEVVVVTSGYSQAELAALQRLGCRIVGLSEPACTSDSRNLGVAASSGDYLLFLDDDNVVAPDAISLMLDALGTWSDAALVGPSMYYLSDPGRLWCAGVHRSRILMRTTFRQQLPGVIPQRMPSDDLPNCFMVRRDEFCAVNGFDSVRFPQHYEEADFAHRLVRHTGRHVYVVPTARIWHDIDSQLVHRLHLHNGGRAYLCARGRAMFTAVHGDNIQWAAFLMASQWLFAALYVGAAIRLPSDDRGAVIRSYLRGFWAGLVDGRRARAERRAYRDAPIEEP